MARKVRFRASAEGDLFALYDYIAGVAGWHTAGDYIGRIEAACMQLETFPERGTRRDDLAPGLRTVGFERRVTIAFRVLPDPWKSSRSPTRGGTSQQKSAMMNSYFPGQNLTGGFRPQNQLNSYQIHDRQ